MDIERKAALICAHLLRQGYVKKSEYPALEIDEQLLRLVKEYLANVGMQLVLNVYSPYYAIRLENEIQDDIEESNNLGLKNNEVAMLVILWCKLILPKRLAMAPEPITIKSSESEEIKHVQSETSNSKEIQLEENTTANGNVEQTDEPENTEHEKQEKKTAKDKKEDKIFIKANELHAEFGEHFGSKTAFKSTLTRLSRLQFIRVHNEIITEGIFLDLLIDGHQMGNEIKRSALAFKLAGLEDEELDDWEEEEDFDEDEPEQEILQAPSAADELEQPQNINGEVQELQYELASEPQKTVQEDQKTEKEEQ